MRRVAAIIVAAGEGRRFGAAGEGRRFGAAKQFARLRGRPVLDWCLDKFIAHAEIDEIVLVLPDERAGAEYSRRSDKIIAIVKGGRRRQDSVRRGVEALDPKTADIVLVHDGVRPLLSPTLISRVIREAGQGRAVIPVIPIEDTVKEVSGGEVMRTLNRARLFRVQTPQGFPYALLRRALERAGEEAYPATDEAELVERLGEKVTAVDGETVNIKITRPEDLVIAEAWLDV